MEKLTEHWLISLIVILLVIPGVINIGITVISVGSGSDDAWLGFWGTYLGIIVTGWGIIYQLRKDKKEELDQRKKELIESEKVRLQKIEDQKVRENEARPIFSFSFLGGINEGYNEDLKIVYPVNSDKEYIYRILKSEFDEDGKLFYVNVIPQKPIQNVTVNISYKFFDDNKNEDVNGKEFFKIGSIYEKSSFAFIPSILDKGYLNEFISGIRSVFIAYTDYFGVEKLQKLEVIKKFEKETNEISTSLGETGEITLEKGKRMIEEIRSPENENKSFVIIEPLKNMLENND